MLLDEKAALWLLGGVCDAFGVSLDRSVLLGPEELPYTEQKLFQVGRRLGFRFDFSIVAEASSLEFPLPFLLFLKAGAADAAWATPALVLGEDEGHLLYFLEGAATPRMISADNLSDLFGPFVVLISHDAQPGKGAISGFSS